MNRNMHPFRILGLAFTLWMQSIAQASPSAEVKWLMEEPLSLFDMGIHRANFTVENALAKFKEEVNRNFDDELIYLASSHIKYDWNKDEINIQWHLNYRINALTSVGSKKEAIDTQEEINEFCLAALSSLEGSTFGQSDSWKYFGKERISQHFGHVGYDRADMPKDLYRSIASKINYQAVVQHDTFFSFKGQRNTKLRPMLCEIGYDSPLKTSTPSYIDYYKEMDRIVKEHLDEQKK